MTLKENNYLAQVLLQWFISDQVEEEKNAQLIVDQLRLAGDSSSALLLLDRDLGARKGGEVKEAGQAAPAS